MSNLRLHKALKDQKKKTQQVEQEIYGSLGIPLGGRKLTDVPDRPSFVYVRLRDNQNEVVQAFNNKVTSSYNLPVILHREGTRYIIDSVNTQRYQSNWNNSAAYLPRHGTNHSFYDGGGGDVTWVYSRQIMPYLIYPESTITGSSLKMSPHPFLDTNNQWKVVGGTGTPSLLQYRPTGGNDAIMGLLYLDAPTGNPKLLINSGTPFSNLLTGTGDIYPYIPVPNINTQIPLAAIRLSSGTNYINWDNVYDVRQWLQISPSGTSSSGGGGGGIDTIGFAGLADGLPIGTGTVLNVHGAAFTRSGTVFDLNITDGWVVAPGTWSCISTDNPIFNVSVTANITGSVGVGNKLWLTQSGQNKYFIVHGVGVTGSTSYLNLYGGTDYSLITGSAISSPYYSQAKSPFGFPLSPAKWTVTVTDTSTRSQASPVANTWYNLGSNSITLPIGLWKAGYSVLATADRASGNLDVNTSFSTSNNSVSDASSNRKIASRPSQTYLEASLTADSIISLTTKTTYYIITMTAQSSVTTIYNNNAAQTLVLYAICAYL